MDEFEKFLKLERRKGIVKTFTWVVILIMVTFGVIFSISMLFNDGVKYLLG